MDTTHTTDDAPPGVQQGIWWIEDRVIFSLLDRMVVPYRPRYDICLFRSNGSMQEKAQCPFSRGSGNFHSA